MKTLLTILLIGYTTFGFSQSNFLKDRDADLELGFNTKYNITTAEIGLNLYSEPFWICDEIIIGSEIGLKNNQLIYIPKITYSYNYILVNGSLSFLNYNYSDNHSFYLRPQIGFTTFGDIDIVYGYNISLNQSNREFQGSILTIRFNKLFETFNSLKEVIKKENDQQ